MQVKIDIPADEIRDFCKRHQIRRLALFGSVLGDQFTPESDVDVLVEFEPDAVPDLFALVDMQDELSNILGRDVDLNTPGFLSRHFRQQVVDIAEVLYERTGHDTAA